MRTRLQARWLLFLCCLALCAHWFAMGCSSAGGGANSSPNSTLIPIELPTQYSFSKKLSIGTDEFSAGDASDAASSIVMSHVSDVNSHLDALLGPIGDIIVDADTDTTIAIGALEDGTDWIIDFTAFEFSLDGSALGIDFSTPCSGNAIEYPVCARFYINGRRMMLTYLASAVTDIGQGRGGFRLVSTNTTETSLDALLSGAEDYLASGIFDFRDPNDRQLELIWGSITPDNSGAIVTSARALLHEMSDTLQTTVDVNTTISVLENGDAGNASARLSWIRNDDCFYASSLDLSGSQGDTSISDTSLLFGSDENATCDASIDTSVVPEAIIDGATAEDLGIPQSLTAPSVVSIAPADASTNVALNSSVIIAMSEPVTPASVTTDSIIVTPALDSTVNVLDNIITIIPSSELAADTTYTIRLTTALTDLDDTAMLSDVSSQFTTESAATEPSIDDTAPTVVTTTPNTDADDASPSAAMSATFSEAVDPTSVTSSSVTLHDGSDFLTADVSAAGDTALLTPDARLTLLHNYTATLGTDITDSAGNPLTSEHSWNFRVRDGIWDTPTSFESLSATTAYVRHVERDQDGNIIVVFTAFDGDSSLYVKRFTASTRTWGDAELLESSSESASRSNLVVLPNGDAWAAWSHLASGKFTTVYYNRYDAATDSWDGPQFLSSGTDTIKRTFLIPKSNGDMMLRWLSDDGADNYTLRQRTYDGSSWDVEESTSVGVGVSDMHCATNFDYDAVCSWYEWDGSMYDIYAEYYDPDDDLWFPANDIDGSDTNTAVAPVSIVDVDRNITMAWMEQVSGQYVVRARRFALDTDGDTGVVGIESDTSSSANELNLAHDASGNAILVWTKEDGGGTRSAWTSRFDNSSGLWSTPQLLENDTSNAVVNTRIAMDANGNAVALWRQHDGTRYNMYSSRYIASTDSWGSAELRESLDTGNTSSPFIHIHNDGSGVALFSIVNGNTDIMVTHFE